jgi:hypothetical protein
MIPNRLLKALNGLVRSLKIEATAARNAAAIVADYSPETRRRLDAVAGAYDKAWQGLQALIDAA